MTRNHCGSRVARALQKQRGMNDGTATPTTKPPMMLRDVFLVLLAMTLLLFALQPRQHAHGGRRREADNVADVQTGSAGARWQRYEAEALEVAVVRPSFDASL
jgi:hypothetical protein